MHLDQTDSACTTSGAAWTSPGTSALYPAAATSLNEWKRAWFRRGREALAEATSSADRMRSEKLARLEAALFVADQSFSAKRLAQLATLADGNEARQLIDALNAAYDADGSSFRVEQVASGYRLLTRPEFSTWISKLYEREAHVKLSPAAMETLTIIAYRQPITRADVEAIRGVQATDMIKQLMERGLVRISGEDDSLGRPFLYGTTRMFLETFGITSLEKLPMADELRRPAADSATREPEVDESSDNAPADNDETTDCDETADGDETADVEHSTEAPADDDTGNSAAA